MYVLLRSGRRQFLVNACCFQPHESGSLPHIPHMSFAPELSSCEGSGALRKIAAHVAHKDVSAFLVLVVLYPLTVHPVGA